MNNSSGSIFQAVPGTQPTGPFTPASPEAAAPSPFAAVGASPFAVAEDANGARPVEPGKPAKLPEKRAKTDSPFQIANEQVEGFEPSSPFAVVDGPPAQQPQPATAPVFQATAPVGYPAQPAAAPFSAGWPQPQAPVQATMPLPQAQPQQMPAPVPAAQPGYYTQQPLPAAAPVPAVPAQAQAQPHPVPPFDPDSGSANIRQLELRAIFGVDREMSHEEIFQRARALPGIRHLAKVDSTHASAIDGLRQVLGSLGFGAGNLRVYCGPSPVEFIREGSVVLAAQTDGGFAPGVRETLMLVARELGRA